MSDTKNLSNSEMRSFVVQDNIARMRRDIHIVVQTVHHEILSKTNHLNDSRIIVVILLVVLWITNGKSS